MNLLRADWNTDADSAAGSPGGDGHAVASFDQGGTPAEAEDFLPSLAIDLDPDLVSDWEKAGGLDHRFREARRAAGDLVEDLDEAGRTALLASFDALPDAAQSAVFAELSLRSDGAVLAASDAALSQFGLTAEGAAMVKEWQSKATRNVGILRTRLERILSRIESSDVLESTARWFDELAPETAMAIYRALLR